SRPVWRARIRRSIARHRAQPGSGGRHGGRPGGRTPARGAHRRGGQTRELLPAARHTRRPVTSARPTCGGCFLLQGGRGPCAVRGRTVLPRVEAHPVVVFG